MTIHLPENLERSILDAVRSGRYASLDDAMSEAAAMLVQRLDQKQAQQPAAATVSDGHDEVSSQEVQQRLFNAGLITELKPPITDLTPYQNRRAVPIQGEPISVTALRERR